MFHLRVRCLGILVEKPPGVLLSFVLISNRIFPGTSLCEFRRKYRGSLGADSRYSDFRPSAASPLAVLFKFSESDERHSFFDSSAKGTARVPAVWIGVAYRTQSLSKLSACAGSGRA